MNFYIRTLIISSFVLILPALVMADTTDLLPPGPPGDPASRMKTLNQIEPRIFISSLPYTISEPGAYYLTGNLTGVAGNNGITIASDHVQLDLNGFALIGVSNSLHGIYFSGDKRHNAVIRNGIVRQWHLDGIHAAGAYDSVIEDVYVYKNGHSITNTGMWLQENWQVLRCGAVENEGTGIRAAFSLIRDCSTRWNRGNGYDIVWGSKLQNSSAYYNTSNGVYSIGAAVIQDNMIIGNYKNGIVTGDNSRVERNYANQNWLAGILVGSGCRIEDNHAVNNSVNGIKTEENATGSLVIRNSARGNTWGNYNLNETTHYGTIINNAGPGFYESNPWANFEM